MKLSKSGIVISSLSVIAASYFLLPTDDATQQNIVNVSSTQLSEKDNNITQNLAYQTAPVIHTRSGQTAHHTQHSDQLKQNLAIDRTFETTSDYESASAYGALPSYMADVQIEQLLYDEQGQLIVDEKIKHLIEFFLMASQDEGQEQAIARLREYLTMTLPSSAANEALKIADNYLSYKDSLYANEESFTNNLNDQTTISKLKETLASQKAKRREHLGETVTQALFGYEESYDDFTMTRIEINSDTSLSEQEKDQLFVQAENKLPPALAQSMRYKREERNLSKKINSLKSSGQNADEIHRLRTDFYGEKVANRMAYLEDNSANWEYKVRQFEQDKTSILNNSNLSQDEKNEQLTQLTQNSFTHKEQIKMAVQKVRGQLAQVN